jgi:hypothetical protein
MAGAFAALGGALALALLLSGAPRDFAASFLYGLALFGGNGLLLAYAAERMLSDGTGRKVSPAVGVGVSLFAKVAVLGIGTYVGLVWLDLTAWALVVGAVAALALLTVAVVATGPTAGRKASSS